MVTMSAAVNTGQDLAHQHLFNVFCPSKEELQITSSTNV